MKRSILFFSIYLIINLLNAQDKGYQKLSRQLTSEKPAEELSIYFKDKLPELAHSEIRLLYDRFSAKGRHITFAQFVENLPVYHGMLKVNMNQQLYAYDYFNDLVDITLPVKGKFQFDIDNWANHIRETRGGYPYFKTSVQPIVYATNQEAVFAYQVTTHNDRLSGAYEFIVDAEKGSILTERRIASDSDTSGRGKVFYPDPLTSAMRTYGSPYVDNSNQDIAVLNNERIEVTLTDITYDSNLGIFKLEGPYVKLRDLSPPVIPPVTSTTGDFFYTRAQNGFEDVNAYYHINGYQRYVRSLGFDDGLLQVPLLLDPHGGTDDNSYFSPDSEEPSINMGTGGVDDAEDADVCIHEYGHALSYGASPNTNGNDNERRGLDEGFGDYMAASYSKSISNYRWNETFTWDGHNSFWDGRLANKNQNYSTNLMNFYDYGEIWASALMMVYDRIGRTASDANFFTELYMNSTNTNVKAAANKIIVADSINFSGQHTNDYIIAFCAKKIFTGAICNSVSREVLLERAKTELSVFPNPANGSIWLQVDGKLVTSGQARIWNIHGQLVREINVIPETPIDVSNLTPGVYHIDFIVDNHIWNTRFVLTD
ncbi:MAG: T9SS type A sorting domain-containing protein [Bacteroidia bacterium]|nr:T9SS type A sorting domain-containing protein [Bacteroidia bacterium]